MSKTILVVDDEAVVRSLLQRYLRGKGAQVLTAGTGEEALATVSKEKLDLILLDIRMPGMSGVEVLKKLKEDGSTVPVIMISGVEDFDTISETIASGAKDFIKKPFDLEYLDASPPWQAWLTL